MQTPPDHSTPEVGFAVDAVRRAVAMARRIRAHLTEPSLAKSDQSPVTVADFAIQALLGRLLSESFPADPLVAEEDSSYLRGGEGASVLGAVTSLLRESFPEADSESVCAWIDKGGSGAASRFWTLDPIDGTKGFLRGEQYAVALALLEEGQVQIGVLGCPNLETSGRSSIGGRGSLLVAVRGQGSWAAPLDGEDGYQRLRVSGRRQAAEARLLRSVESGHTNTSAFDRLAETLGTQAAPVLMDSQAKYAVLAAGAGELLFRLLSPARPKYREKIWDQAAGSLVVEEAGGKVSDLTGASLDFTRGRTLAENRGVVASNGALHRLALRAVKELGIDGEE
ncbi:MAG: 3'(2'),5'-bisphosphate nucleotidase [Acidobacteriota bacterium]